VDAHRSGIVHRDIKPSNATVQGDGNAYLVDFGICSDAAGHTVLTTAPEGFGNPAFSAPECDAGHLDRATPAADVYSLGKLLFWLVSGRGLISREDFDPARLAVTDQEREVIVPILAATICADPTSRCTSEELVQKVQWALDRLDWQRGLSTNGIVIVRDGFGPADEVNVTSTLSARTPPPAGNPQVHFGAAEAIATGDASVELVAIELELQLRSGDGKGRVSFETDLEGIPSGKALASWPIEITSRSPTLVRLEPDSPVNLAGRATYWVVLSTDGENADIAWVGAPERLRPREALTAKLIVGGWRQGRSRAGPGLAVRVTARYQADG
jgi:serine/threonine protein kinase